MTLERRARSKEEEGGERKIAQYAEVSSVEEREKKQNNGRKDGGIYGGRSNSNKPYYVQYTYDSVCIYSQPLGCMCW